MVGSNQSQIKPDGEETGCCESVGFAKQDSNEAEEAGLSMEWAAKKRALA